MLDRDMSAACCLISFILFLALLDNSPGPAPADRLEADTELAFIFEEDDDDRELELPTLLLSLCKTNIL